MVPVNIVVIGGSAGALDPLRVVVSSLPPDFPVLAVIHISPDYPSHLPEILGHSYAAPPGHHLRDDVRRHGSVPAPGSAPA